MKNKYVTKLLCITLISAMVFSSTIGVLASESPAEENEVTVTSDSTEPPTDPTGPPVEPTEPPVEPTEPPTPEPTEPPTDPTETPTPDPTETPTPDPTETPTPDPTETPTPDPTETPTPDPTEKPNAVDKAAVANVINMINNIGSVSEGSESVIGIARAAYESLNAEEQALVTNYGTLTAAEKKIASLNGDEDAAEPVDDIVVGGGDSNYTGDVIQGNVVTYNGTSVTNLHAGRTFYLDQLSETYAITFDDDFEDVMDAIEKEYREKNKVSDKSECLVRNWQDILAVYILQQQKAGEKEFVLDKTAKKALADIFAEMNGIVRDKENILLISYENLHVADYVKAHKDDLSKADKKVLTKYTDKDCALLCSTVTAAKGFIRQSAGDEISEERVNVMAAAYSLVGKVGYFWGGKSSVIGWDSSWGSAATVSAAGSSSSGTVKAYGLDCSGFITWAVINGYNDTDMAGAIGDGTSAQWGNCDTINAEEAQPGDLVFQRGPEGGSNNHVGILVGQTEEGDWIAVHCSSSQNGVTVGEAYSASFRYIRRPTFFPTQEEMLAQKEEKLKSLMEQAASLNTTEEKEDKSITETVKEKTDTSDEVAETE